MTSLGQPWWRRYLFSVDHKVIAKQYMLTGAIMAVVGGALAFAMRSQLAWPDAPVVGAGVLAPHRYNAMVTMHGTIMLFWVAMPILVAGFGNYLVPLMIGARDMAFPRLNMASYWIFFTSTMVLVSSFFVPGGTAAGGWTAYPPLSARPEASGVTWGMNLWILAVALEFVAFLVGGINLIVTATNCRTNGMTAYRLPLIVWQQVIAAGVFLLAVGPLMAGATMLLVDRTLGAGFYDPGRGGDPLLFQHLFWFFGHPEVYVLLLPALGIISEVLCVHCRKTLFGYRMILVSTLVAGVLSFAVWAHHQFISGIDPRLATPFSITTIAISVPFAVALFAFIATLVGGSIRFTTANLFAIGFLVTFLVGGVTGVITGAAAADIYLHDTYFIVAHFHYTLVPVVVLAGFSGFYHWFPKMFGRMVNERLGQIHFAATLVFINVTFLPMFRLGLMGHHRRISAPHVFEFLDRGTSLQIASTLGVIGLLAGQLPFLVNILWSRLRGPRAPNNPWRAATLEWSTPSPPSEHNFSTLPTVYRGAYVYSPPKDPAENKLVVSDIEAPGWEGARSHARTGPNGDDDVVPQWQAPGTP